MKTFEFELRYEISGYHRIRIDAMNEAAAERAFKKRFDMEDIDDYIDGIEHDAGIDLNNLDSYEIKVDNWGEVNSPEDSQ